MPDAKYCPPTAQELLTDLQCAGEHSDRDWLLVLCKRSAAYLAAPAQAEPRDPRDDEPSVMGGAAIATFPDAPSPAAEDGKWYQWTVTEVSHAPADAWKDLEERRNHIERQAQEIAYWRQQFAEAGQLLDKCCIDRNAAQFQAGAELRRAEALRTALREYAIHSAGYDAESGSVAFECDLCGQIWPDKPEGHAEGCLASPADRAQGDDRV